MAMMDSEAWIISPIVMHLSCTLYLRSGVKLESDLNNRKKTTSVVVFLGQKIDRYAWICILIISIDP